MLGGGQIQVESQCCPSSFQFQIKLPLCPSGVFRWRGKGFFSRWHHSIKNKQIKPISPVVMYHPPETKGLTFWEFCVAAFSPWRGLHSACCELDYKMCSLRRSSVGEKWELFGVELIPVKNASRFEQIPGEDFVSPNEPTILSWDFKWRFTWSFYCWVCGGFCHFCWEIFATRNLGRRNWQNSDGERRKCRFFSIYLKVKIGWLYSQCQKAKCENRPWKKSADFLENTLSILRLVIFSEGPLKFWAACGMWP